MNCLNEGRQQAVTVLQQTVSKSSIASSTAISSTAAVMTTASGIKT
jgi:hypothetical protein